MSERELMTLFNLSEQDLTKNFDSVTNGKMWDLLIKFCDYDHCEKIIDLIIMFNIDESYFISRSIRQTRSNGC